MTAENATPEAMAAPRPTRAENVPLGILFMVAATIGFAGMHAISKWLIARYPIGEVLFSRSIVSFLACSIFVLPTHGLAVFATRRPRDHVLRGLSQSVSQAFSVIAFALMPLAGAIAINFSAPLWASLLAVLWLRERASPARWAALLSGFLGVVVVANPGTDTLTLGAVFALLNAVMVGTVTMAVRGMTATESAMTLLMWQLATVATFHALLLPLGLRWPSAGDAALMLLSGIVNLAAQYFWTRALVLAPATAVSPFFYFMLVWATGIGFVVWGEVPTVHLLIGSAIVVASGLFLLWYEAQQRARRQAATG
jgi:drug/metabolite transporter (DMT)-like permease